MPDQYTIQTVHTSAAGEPDDVWLESTIAAQSTAILRQSTRPTASPQHVSPLLVMDRSKGLPGDVERVAAHFSARPSVIHVIPLRLISGVTRVELLLTGDVYAGDDYDGTPQVTLTARFAGGPVLASASATVGGVLPVDLSFDLEPVELERVEDVWVEMRSSISATPYAEEADFLETGEGGFRLITGTSLLLTLGADTLVRYFANDDSTAPIGQTDTMLVNSADSMSSSRGPDHNILVYDSAALPPGRLTVQLFALAGWQPRSVRVGMSQGELSPEETSRRLRALRANIPTRGATAAGINLDVQRAQNTPRLLLALPDGDELDEEDEVFEPRKWRVASSASRTLLQTTIEPRRDYGKLEVQLRLLILNGADYATSPETLSDAETWEAPEDNELFGSTIWQLFTGDVPDLGLAGFVGAGGPTLRVFPAVRGSTRWPVLRDLGRYAQGRANQRLVGVSRFESGAGFRDGLLLPEEMAMVNTAVINIPLDSVGSDLPLHLAIQLDPAGSAGFWTQFPGALVACVGASITWDGR